MQGIPVDTVKFKEDFAYRVVGDHNTAHTQKFVSATDCDLWHGIAMGWLMTVSNFALKEMSRTVSRSASQKLKTVFDSSFSVLIDMQSKKKRIAYALKEMQVPYIIPSYYGKGIGDRAAKLSLVELLERLLKNDPRARKCIIDVSDEWKKGKLHMLQSSEFDKHYTYLLHSPHYL